MYLYVYSSLLIQDRFIITCIFWMSISVLGWSAKLDFHCIVQFLITYIMYCTDRIIAHKFTYFSVNPRKLMLTNIGETRVLLILKKKPSLHGTPDYVDDTSSIINTTWCMSFVVETVANLLTVHAEKHHTNYSNQRAYHSNKENGGSGGRSKR